MPWADSPGCAAQLSAKPLAKIPAGREAGVAGLSENDIQQEVRWSELVQLLTSKPAWLTRTVYLIQDIYQSVQRRSWSLSLVSSVLAARHAQLGRHAEGSSER